MRALAPWGPIVGVLFEDGSSDFILTTLARAGIPTHFELTEKESYSHNTRKRAYLKRLGPIYTGFDESTRHRVAENIAKQLMKSEATAQRLDEALADVGWALQGAKLVPLRKEEGAAVIEPVLPNLTDEQKELLRQIVGVYTSGCRSPFLLCRATHTSGPTLLYGGSQPNIEVDADEMDFQRLADEHLLDLTRNSEGDLRGKPTALAINAMRATGSGMGTKTLGFAKSAASEFEPSGSRGPLRVFLCHSSADKPTVREWGGPLG